ncbi:MAG: LysR family transcriptional regulator [Traorella sp.]
MFYEGAYMNIQNLNFFIAAATYGSFTTAAKKLYISQPNLSKNIESLENELGVKLFFRNNKGVTLTKEGVELLEQASKIVNDINDMSNYFKQRKKKTKTLKISIQPIAPLIDVIANYTVDHQVVFNVNQTNRNQVIDDIINSKSKVGFIMTCNMDPLRFNDIFKENHMKYVEIVTANPYVFINNNHPLASNKLITYHDLLPYSRILYNLDNYTKNSIIDNTECKLVTNSVDLVRKHLKTTSDYLIQTPWDKDLFIDEDIIYKPLVDKNTMVSIIYCYKQLDDSYKEFIETFIHSI